MINLSSHEFAKFVASHVEGFERSEDSQWVFSENLPSEAYQLQVFCWCTGPLFTPLPNCPPLPEGLNVPVILERYTFKITDSSNEEHSFETFLGRCKKCSRIFCGKIG